MEVEHIKIGEINMSDLCIKAAGLKGYTPNFRAAEQGTAGAVKVEPSKDSFDKEEKGKSITSKVLIGTSVAAAVALGIWALTKGKGADKVKETVANAADTVKKKAKDAAEKFDSLLRADKTYQKLSKGAISPDKIKVIGEKKYGFDRIFSIDGKKPFTGTSVRRVDNGVYFNIYKGGKRTQMVHLYNGSGNIESEIASYKKGVGPQNIPTCITETISSEHGGYRTVEEIGRIKGLGGLRCFRKLTVFKDGTGRGEVLDPKTLLFRRLNLTSKQQRYDEVWKLSTKRGVEDKLIVDLAKLSPKKRAEAVKKLPQYLFADVK